MSKRIVRSSTVGMKGLSESKARARRRVFAGMEALEGRTFLSAAVINTADSGPGSLRQAILDVNGQSGPQTITFAIPSAGGVQTISVRSPLPALVANNVTIDATTQAGYMSRPVVMIDGSASALAGSPLSVGLEVDGAGDVVRGLGIEGFSYAQMVIGGAGGSRVTAGTFGLGTNPFAFGVQNANGIVITSANNVIGGGSALDRNVISGNGWTGVIISGNGNSVVGNYVGMDVDGVTAAGNNNNGVEVNGAAGITISGNVISSNNGEGIVLVNVAGGLIAGNVIGLDATGAMWMPNAMHGVHLVDSSNVTIGGTTAGDGNVISGNFADGVRLMGSSSNVIAGNFIGTDASGLWASDSDDNLLGNNGNGITIEADLRNPSNVIDSANNLIGGPAGARNVITGSAEHGIKVSTVGASNRIEANYVGTDRSGVRSVDAQGETFGNDGDGINIAKGGATIVGNVVAGNRLNGMTLSDNSVVLGNFVGVGADAATPLPNRAAGIYVAGNGNVVGGVAAGAGNRVAFNFKQGIVVAFGTRNAVRGNSVYANTGIGIDLGNDGVTANDSKGHFGANGFQNFPTIMTATSSLGSLTFAGELTGVAGTYTVDFYTSPVADPSGFGEGRAYVGSATVTIDGSGHGAFNVTFANAASSDVVVAATATDGNGNTSEFGAAVPIVMSTPSPDQTSVAVGSSANPSTFGQSVTLTATVTDLTHVGTVATGMVRFFDGNTLLGAGALDGAGQAAFTVAHFSAGGHSITAVYDGDLMFVGSTSAVMSQVVNRASTGTVLVSSASSSDFGQSVTFVATVSAPGADVPTGSVMFMEGGTVLGTATLAGGSASFAISNLGVGHHMITAVYGGDSSFMSSNSAAVDQAVRQVGTMTSLTTSQSALTVGQGMTLSAVVGGVTPGSGVPTGMVTFMDGSLVVGVVAVAADGSASVMVSGLSVGNHSFTAVYGGDATFTGSGSPAVGVVVNKAGTTTTVVSSKSSAVIGQMVTFTASVGTGAMGAGSPTGTVTFMDGTTVLGVVAVSGGKASISLDSLAIGSHAITATYGGDGNFVGSGGSVGQTVNKDTTLVSLSSSLPTSTDKDVVTFTAIVTRASGGSLKPGGVVTFMDGSVVLGTGTLVNGVATFTTDKLSVGTHTITAVYGGDASFVGATSLPLTETVEKAKGNSGTKGPPTPPGPKGK